MRGDPDGATGSGGSNAGGAGGVGGTGGTGGIPIGAPISAPDDTWTWVPFPDAKCRDGSSTGIGVNLKSASQKLMIYFQGGGACFNSLTCATNPSHFDESDFTFLASGKPQGIFDRENSANPVKDFNFVYVPYCTGDVHGGMNPDHPGGSGIPPNQAFVGYSNFTSYLSRILATVVNPTQVLVTGESAGGYGSAGNFLQTQRAYPGASLTLIDDSGPMMAKQWAAPCLQDGIRTAWKLDATLLADCGSACTEPDDFLEAMAVNMVSSSPSQHLGLISSLGDEVITYFLGFGKNGCTGVASQLSPAEYQAGLEDLRDRVLGPYPKFRELLHPGNAAHVHHEQLLRHRRGREGPERVGGRDDRWSGEQRGALSQSEAFRKADAQLTRSGRSPFRRPRVRCRRRA